MDNGTKKHLNFQLSLVAISAVLIGGFGISSVYGQAETSTDSFKTDFELLSFPLCGGETASSSITAHFVFHQTKLPDGTVRESVTFNYMKSKAFGESGDRYEVNEVRHSTINDNSNTDVFHSVITGKLVHNGKQTNTGVFINLLTTFDDDGEPKTVVEKVDVKCTGGNES